MKCKEKYLGNKGDKLSEMVRLFVRIDAENLSNAIIMIPLLKKLLFVRDWIALDQVLKLGKI